MTGDRSTVATFFDGWRSYQTLLVAAIVPLGPDQLALRPAPGMRSVGETVRHVIGARARWFHIDVGVDDERLVEWGGWDRRDAPDREAGALVEALEGTWRVMHDAMAGWADDDWAATHEDETNDPVTFTNRWIVWHLIEHDVHHGGEIAITLGMHGLPAPAL
jgi:uncharacterized damage-inducible protein DinB